MEGYDEFRLQYFNAATSAKKQWLVYIYIAGQLIGLLPIQLFGICCRLVFKKSSNWHCYKPHIRSKLTNLIIYIRSMPPAYSPPWLVVEESCDLRTWYTIFMSSEGAVLAAPQPVSSVFPTSIAYLFTWEGTNSYSDAVFTLSFAYIHDIYIIHRSILY